MAGRLIELTGATMLSFLLRRLFYAAITFIGITLVIFLLIHASPGDPVRYYLSTSQPMQSIPEDVIASIRARYGLDQPIHLQYARWLHRVVRLDFGNSFTDRRPVRAKIARGLGPTIELNVLATSLALLIGFPLGIWSGSRPRGRVDRWSSALAFFLYSLPSFWVALLLMEWFAVRLEILPLFGMHATGWREMSASERFRDHLLHLVLPVITLAYAQVAVFLRFTRSAIAESFDQDFILAARARGVGEARLLFSHALRNAAVPMITLLGLILPYLLSGSIIVERIFQWNGIGKLYFDAILSRDYPVIMGLSVLTAVAVLGAMLLADLLYAVADPRIRVGEGAP
ncbi:MAG TPA: ABC transporter permease [Thermoanaerobaculia bacterium]|nr:ABC transporter permease [Thermoanaerobaculia bacterium]